MSEPPKLSSNGLWAATGIVVAIFLAVYLLGDFLSLAISFSSSVEKVCGILIVAAVAYGLARLIKR